MEQKITTVRPEQEHIYLVLEAHQDYPRESSKAFRKWDGKTPYFIHPLWCATTIATETDLDEKTRQEGYLSLLYHDVLEDTTQSLSEKLEQRIIELVENMTFLDGISQERQEIWGKPREVRLYKLYDKVSNLLDGSWMSDEKKREYQDYTQDLCKNVEQNYGPLNITKIARGVMEK
jgi:(p)ppGpp synthase/HD superfamily hydrolase